MLKLGVEACRRGAEAASREAPVPLTPQQLLAALDLSRWGFRRCQHRRHAANAAANPIPEVNPAPSEAVIKLVDGVENLTVKELVWFNKLLQERLGISDADLGIGVPMQMAAPAAHAPGDAGAAPAEEKKAEKTAFNVVIERYEPSAKIKIIKEVRAMVPGLGLKDGKEMVRSAMHDAAAPCSCSQLCCGAVKIVQ
jgi:ribosomal protein L7/L12